MIRNHGTALDAPAAQYGLIGRGADKGPSAPMLGCTPLGAFVIAESRR